MFLKTLELNNFRCFENKTIEFKRPITFITGDNGVGKTSILEAIHYLCYFKSFRAHLLHDVLQAGNESFFLKSTFDREYEFGNEEHSLQVGYFQKKKSVKLDQKMITSYKQILAYFQVVTLTEDDIDLIKGYPAVRRAFIDQAVMFSLVDSFDTYRNFRQFLQHKNALLSSGRPFSNQDLEIWNHGLWQHSLEIQKYRISTLKTIEKAVNIILEEYFDGVYEVALQYETKMPLTEQGYEFFEEKIARLVDQERIMKRSLFGAHLDDVSIKIRNKKARIFASRGQQKLISMLCKLSWASMKSDPTERPIMLIDDFIADFDQIRLEQLITFFIKCKNQIILTAPFCDEKLKNILQKADPDVISL